MAATLRDVKLGDLIELTGGRTAIVIGGRPLAKVLVMSPSKDVGHAFIDEKSFVQLLLTREDVVSTCLDSL